MTSMSSEQQQLEAGIQALEGQRALLGDAVASALALARSAVDILVATQARDREVDARLKLGQAELALGRYDAARQAFKRMQQLAQEIDSPWQHDAAAALAQLAFAQGDDVQALRELDGVLAHSARGGTLDGTVKPRLIELTCHKVLARACDARAAEWLTRAHGALQAQAMTIADGELCRSFLRNVPCHREIVEAFMALTRVRR
jgi:tetratricopeptide (TPR) repeat protein